MWGNRYLVHLHCGDFSLCSIFFSSHAQKRKTNNFHPLSSFYARFVCWFWLVTCFCFLCAWNIFVKKNKESKTALITSFTLLLQYSQNFQLSNENICAFHYSHFKSNLSQAKDENAMFHWALKLDIRYRVRLTILYKRLNIDLKCKWQTNSEIKNALIPKLIRMPVLLM